MKLLTDKQICDAAMAATGKIMEEAADELAELKEQITALQATNEKLVERVRKLCEIDIESDKELMAAELAVDETGTDIPIRDLFQKYVNKIRELEKQLAETTEWLAAQVRISKKYWEALDEVRTKARAALEGE